MTPQRVDEKLYYAVDDNSPNGEKIILDLPPGANRADYAISLASEEQRRWVETRFVATRIPERGDSPEENWSV